MEKKKLIKMFEDLCCSNCHNAFEEDAITIVREEKDFYVLQIVCNKCLKSFGLALLGNNPFEIKDDKNISTKKIKDEDLILKIEEDTPPISYDDVLDAHEYIKNLDKNWQNFINGKKL